MTEESKFIDETADPVKKLQNRLVGIVILFIFGVILYLTGRNSASGMFDLLLLAFMIVNSLYLIVTLVKYNRVKSNQDSD